MTGGDRQAVLRLEEIESNARLRIGDFGANRQIMPEQPIDGAPLGPFHLPPKDGIGLKGEVRNGSIHLTGDAQPRITARDDPITNTVGAAIGAKLPWGTLGQAHHLIADRFVSNRGIASQAPRVVKK